MRAAIVFDRARAENAASAMAVIAACLLVAACQSRGPSRPVDAKAETAPRPSTDEINEKEGAMKIISPAFEDGRAIPSRHTCEGTDISVPLEWSALPEGTRSLALIVDDPDAPDPAAPKMVWVHWVLYDIPPTATGLEEGVEKLPEGTREGRNDWKRTGYGGPCPPIGRHRYFHKLYALDTVLGDLGQPDKPALLSAMRGHVLAEAVLVGTYQKGE